MSKFYRRVVDGVVSLLESSVEINDPDLTEITLADYLQASVPPALTNAEQLAQAKARATQRTIAFANTIRERIASSTHYLKSARWPTQLASAQAVKAGAATALDTAVLEREARNRELGESVDQLADKVITNSVIFSSVGAAIDGIERATLDRVAACTDVAGFEAILTAAKAKALTEFLDIFTPFYGAEGAQERAAQFFGA